MTQLPNGQNCWISFSRVPQTQPRHLFFLLIFGFLPRWCCQRNFGVTQFHKCFLHCFLQNVVGFRRVGQLGHGTCVLSRDGFQPVLEICKDGFQGALYVLVAVQVALGADLHVKDTGPDF